jgi:DNA-binding NarL/FixJ family response regulator
MDISMPLLNGLEATRQIHRTVPSTKVLILSAHSDQAYVDQAAVHGAAGYVVKQTAAEVLTKAIRDAHRGATVFRAGPSLNRQNGSAESPAGRAPPIKTASELTSREVEVLQLVAEGMANKQVAAELGISTKTVEKHRDHLMAKLGIHDTAGLTRYAAATGIIEIHRPVTRPVGLPTPKVFRTPPSALPRYADPATSAKLGTS